MHFAMSFAILAFFAVDLRWCDGICVHLRYLRFLRVMVNGMSCAMALASLRFASMDCLGP